MLETGLKFCLRSGSRDWGRRGHTWGRGRAKSTGAHANICPAAGELSVGEMLGSGVQGGGIGGSGSGRLWAGRADGGSRGSRDKLCSRDHSPPVPGTASRMPEPCHFVAVSR